jgi:hypothetical protein
MSSSQIEQVSKILAGAVKVRLTSEQNGAKLRTTKNKFSKSMINNLIRQIIGLENQSMKDLRSTYEKTNTNSKPQLVRQIAYRLQELEYGFLSDRCKRKLDLQGISREKVRS